MSDKSLRIHPDALEEAGAAVAWYARRSKRAASMFLDELDRAVDRISQNPEQCPCTNSARAAWSCGDFLL